jgi:hypothetical protein
VKVMGPPLRSRIQTISRGIVDVCAGRGGRRPASGPRACAGAAGVRFDGVPVALGTAGAAVTPFNTRLIFLPSDVPATCVQPGVIEVVCLPCAPDLP